MTRKWVARLLMPAFVFAAGLVGLTPLVAAQDAENTVQADVMEKGGALYQKNCKFCHGTKGTAGKPLAGNENLEDADYVAGVILVGPGYMTPFKDHLSDEEIALIVTYVRNSWGNSWGAADPANVAELR